MSRKTLQTGASNRLLFPELSENPWDTYREIVSRPSYSAGLATLELCAGAGGQALGLEQAGIVHAGLVELNKHACATLRLNRPSWNVLEQDVSAFDGAAFKGIDIISGGLPCPPFSVAGKQLGQNDERNLFPSMIRLVDQVRPKAVMIENVRGMMDGIFGDYRQHIAGQLKKLGYETGWKLMNACDFGVPQLRPRVFFMALRRQFSEHFSWPAPSLTPAPNVGELLYDLIASRGWREAGAWRDKAYQIAPTIVGGSHKHGGPDLGPTRARSAWAALGVDGLGIADDPPAPEFTGMPRLTVRMVARIQGFPDHWEFTGKKTAAYRQVGNALPPPFARAVADSVVACLSRSILIRVTG
ncbi:MAG TPA: DNA cytosine methyltransferase [Bryobacteraceae bacterium]|nr:DNA cytosine methyltransferase [Bryobacteraceae bacterium]